MFTSLQFIPVAQVRDGSGEGETGTRPGAGGAGTGTGIGAGGAETGAATGAGGAGPGEVWQYPLTHDPQQSLALLHSLPSVHFLKKVRVFIFVNCKFNS